MQLGTSASLSAAPIEVGSLAELIRAHARITPDRPALTFGSERWDFAELDRRSNRAAAALAASGVVPGDRVVYLGKNSLDLFALMFGASKLGAVFVPANWRLAATEVANVINDAGAGLVVVGESFEPVVAAVRDELTTVTTVVTLRREGPQADGFVRHARWVGSDDHPDPGHRPGPDDVALQLYTSGTTGVPKGVMLTNRNIWGMLPPTAGDWGFGPTSVNLMTLPNFHVGGIAWSLVGLYVGASTIVLPEFEAAAVLATIPAERITHAVFVPAIISALLATPGVDEVDFSSVDYIVYGASPISETVLVDAMERFGCRFIQSYGLTETCGGVIQLLADDHDPGGPRAHLLRSAGRPMAWVEMRVVDPTTRADRPAGEVGEVWLRSPRVMAGYWRRPEETAAAVDPDGWFHTGDAGFLDVEGYLYISDRVKDMIISGGENVYPAEIENVLMAHPDVADVAVIGVPSERWGETPKALVVAAPGAEPDEHVLIAFCRDRLARYKCPTSVDIVASLPRNPTGKVLKHELRAPFWSGRDRHVN